MMTKSRYEYLEQNPFTLSLSSGFFGYFAHIGFLQALDLKNLKPTEIAGSSAGALVAAGLASGQTIQDLTNVFLKIKKEDFWDPQFGFGYIKGEKIENLLSEYCVERFDQTTIPLKISAFNINRLKTEVISTGSVAKACRASASVPGLFHPVKINNHYYYDGGVQDRPGHKAFNKSELIPVIHYLKYDGILSSIEDNVFYKKLHNEPFLLKTKNPFEVGPFNLSNGSKIIDYYKEKTLYWLEEKF